MPSEGLDPSLPLDRPPGREDPETRRSTRGRAAIALAALLPAPTLGALALLYYPQGKAGLAISFALKVWIAVFPLVWTLRVERRSLDVLAWRGGRGLGLGVLSGAIILVAMVIAFLLARDAIDLDPLRERARETGFDQPVKLLAMFAYLITVNSLLEEYVWRWFVVAKIREALGSGSSRAREVLVAILGGLAFTVHHVFALLAWVPAPVAALGSLGVFFGGATWSWLFARTRSLWPGYVSHVFADIAILWMAWELLIAG